MIPSNWVTRCLSGLKPVAVTMSFKTSSVYSSCRLKISFLKTQTIKSFLLSDSLVWWWGTCIRILSVTCLQGLNSWIFVMELTNLPMYGFKYICMYHPHSFRSSVTWIVIKTQWRSPQNSVRPELQAISLEQFSMKQWQSDLGMELVS